MHYFGCIRQRSEPLTIKSASWTARNSSVSSAFQTFPMDELKSLSIKGTMVVRELPTMRPTEKLSERIRHWFHLANIPIEVIERGVMVLICCDVPETYWIRQHRLGSEGSPMSCAPFWAAWYSVRQATQPIGLGWSTVCPRGMSD